MIQISTTRRLILSALIATGLAGAGGALAAGLEQIRERGVIRIAVANEIPYGYMNMSGEPKGIGPEVATEIMSRLGVKKIEWTATSFSSLIPGLKANRFDMVAAEMAVLPARCEQVMFSEPNSSYGEGLLVAKGNPDNIHAYEDFAKSDTKVAIMAGADQLEMLQALKVPQNQIVTISNNADAISTVSTGRAAAYAATSLTVSELARKSDKVEAAAGFTDPVIDGQPVRSWGAFTFAQGSEDLRDAVNGELAKLKQTDRWVALMKDNGFSDTDAKASFQRTAAQLCAK